MIATQNRHSVSRTRFITCCGMLTATAVVLQYLEVSIPIMPSFIKLDFSDLPELLGAFAYGPLAGVIITLLKNLIHLAVSQSGFVGELSNFILGSVFCAVAGLVYRKKHTKTGALLAGMLASVSMALVCYPVNYYVVYPVYYQVFAPEAVVLQAYQEILPSAKSISSAILIFNVPFTLIKGLLDVALSMLLYKRLAKVLFHRPKKTA